MGSRLAKLGSGWVPLLRANLGVAVLEVDVGAGLWWGFLGLVSDGFRDGLGGFELAAVVVVFMDLKTTTTEANFKP